MSAGHTPGPWVVEADPLDNQGYVTLITLPGKAGSFGTWIARAEHNWNDATAGERRISWAEAEANARLITAAPDLLAAIGPLMRIIDEGVSTNISDAELKSAHPEDRRFIKRTRKALEVASAAIAKAKGGAS